MGKYNRRQYHLQQTTLIRSGPQTWYCSTPWHLLGRLVPVATLFARLILRTNNLLEPYGGAGVHAISVAVRSCGQLMRIGAVRDPHPQYGDQFLDEIAPNLSSGEVSGTQRSAGAVEQDSPNIQSRCKRCKS